MIVEPDLEDRVRWIEEELNINPKRKMMKEYIEHDVGNLSQVNFSNYVLGDKDDEALIYFNNEVSREDLESLLARFMNISILPEDNRVVVKVRGINKNEM